MVGTNPADSLLCCVSVVSSVDVCFLFTALRSYAANSWEASGFIFRWRGSTEQKRYAIPPFDLESYVCSAIGRFCFHQHDCWYICILHDSDILAIMGSLRMTWFFVSIADIKKRGNPIQSFQEMAELDFHAKTFWFTQLLHMWFTCTVDSRSFIYRNRTEKSRPHLRNEMTNLARETNKLKTLINGNCNTYTIYKYLNYTEILYNVIDGYLWQCFFSGASIDSAYLAMPQWTVETAARRLFAAKAPAVPHWCFCFFYVTNCSVVKWLGLLWHTLVKGLCASACLRYFFYVWCSSSARQALMLLGILGWSSNSSSSSVFVWIYPFCSNCILSIYLYTLSYI